MALPIFLSRPSVVADSFRDGFEGFERLLGSLGFEPRTIGKTHYPTKAPLDKVIEVFGECRGAIILGIPQISIEYGRLRDEKLIGELVLGTEWNHIEAALAYALKLPLLLIHHTGMTRGVFDRGALNTFLYERDLGRPEWPLEERLQGALRSWMQECQAASIPTIWNRSNAPQGVPPCPNCGRHMSPIPPDFRGLEGADWECRPCKFTMRVGLPE